MRCDGLTERLERDRGIVFVATTAIFSNSTICPKGDVMLLLLWWRRGSITEWKSTFLS